MKFAAIALLLAAVNSSIVFTGCRIARSAQSIPTALVQRADFVDYVPIRGQASARESVTISAPYEAGDLQIIKLAANGIQVKKGDVLVQFDTTKIEQTLAQDQSALKTADAQIQQSRAQAKLKEEQDLTDVMKGRYNVQSAKLDASKAEIESKIDGAEANLKLADAEENLKQAEQKLKSDQMSDEADIQSQAQKRDQAVYQVRQAEHSLSMLELRAPINGMVNLMTNWRASGPFGGGMPFKQGDRAWPGAPIAELPDLSTMQITGRVDETARGRIEVGQTAMVRIDAIPDKEFTTHVTRISEIASTDFAAGWPFPRNFAIDFSLSNSDDRLRAGMTANVRIVVDRVANGIILPADALFHKEGESVVYVLHGSQFEQRMIHADRRSGDQVLVEQGVQPGERVALVDPTAPH
ncbi:MAG TPA: efflux RND transporter periplasmic adaptor subunit [Terriglobales bacterium]|nr:efflux RND transporter periplasmic adaptor subunit [Terriglobales bacterium]